MLPHYLWTALCFSLLAMTVTGEEPLQTLNPTPTEFCETLLKEDSTHVRWWNRRKLSQLEKQVIDTQDPLYGNTPWRGNNTIFVFAPRPKRSQKTVIKEWKKALEPLDHYSKDARHIGRASSTSECLVRLRERNFDYLSFLRDSKNVSEKIKILKPELEAHAMDKQINKLSRWVKKRWYIRRVFHMDDLKKELLKLDAKNIFIVAHARQNGQIVDSYNNALPASFFEDISPTIFSISLYNCYSTKTLDFYSLRENLDQENFYKFRYLFGVEEDDDFSKEQYAPLSRASKFINKVDRNVRRNISDSFWGFSERPEYCSVTLDENSLKHLGQVGQKEIHLSLAGKYLGTFRKDSGVIQFKCEYLKEGSVLFARPNEPLDIEFTLSFSNGRAANSKDTFKREGKVIGKRLTF